MPSHEGCPGRVTRSDGKGWCLGERRPWKFRPWDYPITGGFPSLALPTVELFQRFTSLEAPVAGRAFFFSGPTVFYFSETLEEQGFVGAFRPYT